MNIPDAIQYCIIGGGVHGLSTAWHLASRLAATHRGSGKDIVVLEKRDAGSGASGIACGVVRNFYFSPAMSELVRLSVEVWESDPKAFGYHPVGYIAAVPKQQVNDLIAIHKKESEVGYTSELHLGEAACRKHMRGMLGDFHCEGIEGVLHEKLGGYAVPRKAIEGLRRKVEECGVSILSGIEVTGFELGPGGVSAVETSQGRIRCEAVVIGAGPWSGRFWKMLGLPSTVELKAPDGRVVSRPMWSYWQLREGSIETDKPFLQDDGKVAPVIHLDHSIPLLDERTGETIEPGAWGFTGRRMRRECRAEACRLAWVRTPKLSHTAVPAPMSIPNSSVIFARASPGPWTVSRTMAAATSKGQMAASAASLPTIIRSSISSNRTWS